MGRNIFTKFQIDAITLLITPSKVVSKEHSYQLNLIGIEVNKRVEKKSVLEFLLELERSK